MSVLIRPHLLGLYPVITCGTYQELRLFLLTPNLPHKQPPPITLTKTSSDWPHPNSSLSFRLLQSDTSAIFSASSFPSFKRSLNFSKILIHSSHLLIPPNLVHTCSYISKITVITDCISAPSLTQPHLLPCPTVSSMALLVLYDRSSTLAERVFISLWKQTRQIHTSSRAISIPLSICCNSVFGLCLKRSYTGSSLQREKFFSSHPLLSQPSLPTLPPHLRFPPTILPILFLLPHHPQKDILTRITHTSHAHTLIFSF